MPEALKRKLQAKYGKDSDIPYKIMNKAGLMHGSKVTAKGKKASKSPHYNEMVKMLSKR